MSRKIALVANQSNLKTSSQAQQDFDYWITKSGQERLAAVTFLVNQNLKPLQRMDKTVVVKTKMK